MAKKKEVVAPVPAEDLPVYQCNECYFWETQDADSGLCFGIPPQAVQFEGEWGFARPIVSMHDKGCISWRARHTA